MVGVTWLWSRTAEEGSKQRLPASRAFRWLFCNSRSGCAIFTTGFGLLRLVAGSESAKVGCLS
jgi:hypothetical protein